MLLYKNVFSYKDPLKIIFLCGSKYSNNNPREKRKVLKEYLESKSTDFHVIILEENFIFGKTNKQYLAYDEAFLYNLAQVEQLASLYANKIIIIHETISTAAELGMFAINPTLSGKICLLVPDDISIDERKISGFIKMAFMNEKHSIIDKEIIYYPDLELNRISKEKSDYYTYFHNDEIGERLGRKIISCIQPNKTKVDIRIIKCPFGKPTNVPSEINYYIDGDNKIINAFVNVDILKIQLLALFFIEEYRTEFRKIKLIKDHVSFICEMYKKILQNTFAEVEGKNLYNYTIKIVLKHTEICKLREAVGYYLYMLQAINLIGLEQDGNSKTSQRKIRISKEMDACKKDVDGLIYTKRKTEFGRMEV